MANGPVWRCRDCGGTVTGDSTDPDVLRLGIRDHKLARHPTSAAVPLESALAGVTTSAGPVPVPPRPTPEQSERITLERSVPMLAQMVQDLAVKLNETREAVARLTGQGVGPPAIAANGIAAQEPLAEVAYQGPEAPRGGGIMEMVMPLIANAIAKTLVGGGTPTVADPSAALAPVKASLVSVAELFQLVNGIQMAGAELELAHMKNFTETLKAGMAGGADSERIVDALHERAESGLARITASRQAAANAALPPPTP